jgi:hypothetical protein
MFNALRQTENVIHNLGLFFPAWIAARIVSAHYATYMRILPMQI